MIALAEPVKVIPTTPTTANPIESLQKTVSASRLTTFLQCRLKFFFRYVQQIYKPKTPALHVGSVVHLILQAWNMARWRRQEFQLEKFKKLFEDGWKDQPPRIDWDGEDGPPSPWGAKGRAGSGFARDWSLDILEGPSWAKGFRLYQAAAAWTMVWQVAGAFGRAQCTDAVSLAPAKKGFKNHSATRRRGSAAQGRVREAMLESGAEISRRNSGGKVHSAYDDS